MIELLSGLILLIAVFLRLPLLRSVGVDLPIYP